MNSTVGFAVAVTFGVTPSTLSNQKSNLAHHRVKRGGGRLAAVANFRLDNDRENACSVISFDTAEPHFRLHQVVNAVKDAGLNTMRISVKTDEDKQCITSEVHLTNGKGKLSENEFDPVWNSISAFSSDVGVVAEAPATDQEPEHVEYKVVEKLTLPPNAVEDGIVVTVDNYAHRDFTTVIVAGPTNPEISRQAIDLLAAEKLKICFCTLHTVNTANDHGVDVYHVTTARGSTLTDVRTAELQNKLTVLVLGLTGYNE